MAKRLSMDSVSMAERGEKLDHTAGIARAAVPAISKDHRNARRIEEFNMTECAFRILPA